MYVQTAFIHTTHKAISSGTLSDRSNHDHRIKPIGDDNDDGHGDDETHSFTENHWVPAPLLCSLCIFSFNPCNNTVRQLLLFLSFIAKDTEDRRLGNLPKFTLIEYDTSNFTPQPACNLAIHRSPLYGRFTENMGTNGSNVVNQNNHILPKLKKKPSALHEQCPRDFSRIHSCSTATRELNFPLQLFESLQLKFYSY